MKGSNCPVPTSSLGDWWGLCGTNWGRFTLLQSGDLLLFANQSEIYKGKGLLFMSLSSSDG